MMGHTHMAFGFLGGLLSYTVLAPAHPIMFVGIATLAALLPDVDHEGSRINKMFPVTKWVAKLFKHRGFFHSMFPAAGLYFGFWYFGAEWIGSALALGYLTHLFSDSLTKMGVNLLHPIATLRVQGFIQTGGMWEMATLGIVLAVSAVKLWGTFF